MKYYLPSMFQFRENSTLKQRWKPLKMKAITLEGATQTGHLLMNLQPLTYNPNLRLLKRKTNLADVCKSALPPPCQLHQLEESAKANPLRIARKEKRCRMLKPLADIATKRRPRKTRLRKKRDYC